MNVLRKLRAEVEESVLRKSDQDVKSRVVKLKFDDFTQTTAETAGSEMEESVYEDLLRLAWSRGEGKPVRLLGVGVRFASEDDQMNLL